MSAHQASNKATVDEIRAKFDQLANDYSNLDKGQSTAIDSPLCMELITRSASSLCPDARDVMDIGCGGGNYIVKLLQQLNNPNCTLIDLSKNMVERARQRAQEATSGNINCISDDIRNISFKKNQYDIIMAATVLHHLRTEDEWKLVFENIFHALKPGGSFWINDVILHENPIIDQIMLEGWENKMIETGGEAFKEKNMAHYRWEDTPQTLEFQLELMKKIGFSKTYVLHKHFTFAAFGAIK